MIQQRIPYNSDISDLSWNLIRHLIPQCQSSNILGGRPEKYTRREVLNGILYVLTSGCSWSDMPHDLPSGATCWYYFNTWSKQKVFIKI